MNRTHIKTHAKRQGRENKVFKSFVKYQIITACRMELRVEEMTMNEKLTMIGLIIPLHQFITTIVLEFI